jgi:mannitol-specific phosphotransferase system IIBC component
MKPTKNIECTTKNTRKSKFRTEEERRQATLESKRRWAQKNSSKNKDGLLPPELELFEVHKTPDGKMTSIYRPKKDQGKGISKQEIEVLKEKLKELEKENLSVKEKLLNREKTIKSLTKEVASLKNKLEENCEESTPIASIYCVEEDDEFIDPPSEYLSSDENEIEIVVKKRFTEEDIRLYGERRKKGGKKFKHDLDIEKILADRNREITD